MHIIILSEHPHLKEVCYDIIPGPDLYLRRPLLSTGMATCEIIYYDFWEGQSSISWQECLGNIIPEYVKSRKPDAVMIWIDGYHVPERINVYRQFLQNCQENSIVTIHVWPDLAVPAQVNVAESLCDLVSFNLTIAGPIIPPVRDKQKYIFMWSPMDPCFFYNANKERNISVLMSGDTERRDRKQVLSTLTAANINVVASGGRWGEQPLGMNAYADMYRQSKISLNTNQFEYAQTKGRVLEITSCGAMLMEKANPSTEMYFIPGIEYETFSSGNELIDKIKFYLIHDGIRERIANAGYDRYRRCYTPVKFWKEVFSRL